MMNNILLLVVATVLISGCVSQSIHMVKNGYQVSVPGTAASTVTVTGEFGFVPPPAELPGTRIYLKMGIGKSVNEFLIVRNDGPDVIEQFYGLSLKSLRSLKSVTEAIGGKKYATEIHPYDFRFRQGGPLRLYLDENGRVNRPCGVVKTYANTSDNHQILYGKVVSCATLTMSLNNHKKYPISNVIDDLNDSVKYVFNVR